MKKLFKQEEVIHIVSDFKNYLINSGALESNKISDWEFQNYLRSKKLIGEEGEDSGEQERKDLNISKVPLDLEDSTETKDS